MDFQRAEALLRHDVDQRLAALRALEQARAQREQAAEALASAEAAEVTAWAQVESAGWTAAQLRQLNVVRPATKTRNRTRRVTTKKAPTV